MPSTYTPIATTTLGSTTSTVTLSSISAAYTDLILVMAGKNTANADDIALRFNSDTGTNYSRTYLYGDGSSASSGRGSTMNGMAIPGYIAASNDFNSIVQINNYSNTTTNKTGIARGNAAASGTWAAVGLWRSTAAINSITIYFYNGSASFLSGSTFTLYGVKSA